MAIPVEVKFEPSQLLVGRHLRNRAGDPVWYVMYFYEGKVFHVPGGGSTFNKCRDDARKQYRSKALIMLNFDDFIPGISIDNWDIYGAEDGWRLEFSYSKAAGLLSYTQPGKSTHPVEQGDVALIVQEHSARIKPADLPVDPVLSAPDHDFINSSANLPFLVEKEQVYVAEHAANGSITSIGVNMPDPLADQAAQFPAYWKPLPKHWAAIDTYRVDILFPLNDSRLTHARKKLLVCGTRTGGKSIRKDIAEAYATLGQWLAENPED